MFKGKPDRLQNIIKRAFIRAIVQGTRKALDEFLPHVAQDTGLLRTGLENMIKTQVVGIAGQLQVIIGFNELTGVNQGSGDYSKYHIFGPHGQATSTAPYKKPTTPGTRPISETKLLQLIKKKIKIELVKEIRQREGLALSTFDILSTNF